MKCCDILNFYKRSDFNRLAKSKIANYAGLPVDILRDELSKALTTYSGPHNSDNMLRYR